MTLPEYLLKQGITGRTADEYLKAAHVLFGADLSRFPTPTIPANVSRSRLVVLRCACALTAAFQLGLEHVKELPQDKNPWPLRTLPRAKRRLPRWFNAVEYQAYVDAAEKQPMLWRALLLLSLRMGFRRAEILELPRSAVEDGVSQGVLRFVRKGGKDAELPVGTENRRYFRVLLEAPAKSGREWRKVGEILSTGGLGAAYQKFRKLVSETGDSAGLAHVKPHTLRHSCGTHLARRKTNLKVIQQVLGHENPETTMLYMHADLTDAAQALE